MLLLPNAEDWRAVEKYRTTVQYFERQGDVGLWRGKFFRSIYFCGKSFSAHLRKVLCYTMLWSII